MTQDRRKNDAFCSNKLKSELAALSSLFWGNPKAFTPLWMIQGGNPFYYYFKSPYLYEVSSLRNNIKKYMCIFLIFKNSPKAKKKKKCQIF